MKENTIRSDLVNALAMLTLEEVAETLGVSTKQVNRMRTCGLLKATRTGQAWRYSQEEIRDFQRELRGVDISSDAAMIRAVGIREQMRKRRF